MVALTRFAITGILLLALSIGVIINAYTKKGQFYPACMHILRSNASFLPILCTTFYFCIVICIGLKSLFFGQLRIIEHEHMYENTWYSASEILMAMTIFKDEFNTRFAIFFGTLLVGKLAHGLLRDRLDYMEQAAVINRIFYIRMSFLFATLLILDLGFLYYAISHISNNGPSMMLIFAFEAGILTISLFSSIAKYAFNIYDSSLAPEEWESKSMATLYLEIISDFFRLILYMTFFAAVTSLYGLPIHIIRDLYVTLKSLATRVQDLRRYLRATQNMDERYMDATEEELSSSDRLCIICREEMLTAKRLDCGHMFHSKCLKSWLERQQSCPTCRSPILSHLASPSPVPSTVRQSPFLRPVNGNLATNIHLTEDTPSLNEVIRKIETLRKIQAQINEVIVEFDRFKSECDNQSRM